LWSAFGLSISDEVHRVAAPSWSQVFPRFSAAYRLGLSATPRRADGAENVFFWHIGDIIYRSKTKRVTPRLRRILTDFTLYKTQNFDPNRVSKDIQLRFLCKNPERNRLIISELLKALKAGRKVAVLSERRKHLEILQNLFSTVKPDGCVDDFYVGSRTREQLEKASHADVIWCTYQMTKEGLDIPTLDTAFLVTPVADVEQTVGRIMREYEGKKEPIVTDFIDKNVRRFANLWNRRRFFYLREGIFKDDASKGNA